MIQVLWVTVPVQEGRHEESHFPFSGLTHPPKSLLYSLTHIHTYTRTHIQMHSYTCKSHISLLFALKLQRQTSKHIDSHTCKPHTHTHTHTQTHTRHTFSSQYADTHTHDPPPSSFSPPMPINITPIGRPPLPSGEGCSTPASCVVNVHTYVCVKMYIKMYVHIFVYIYIYIVCIALGPHHTHRQASFSWTTSRIPG